MEESFWHDRWREGRLGFHEGRPNALLEKHFERVEAPKDARVFVPLCGKTRDIAWFLEQGLRVAGAELSRVAVEQLFRDLGAAPETAAAGNLERWSAPGLDVFVGNLFELEQGGLGAVDAVYDRAALVALPAPMRERYAVHLRTLAPAAPRLLITFEYDQTKLDGPPFAVLPHEVKSLHADAWEVERLESRPVGGGLKGKVDAFETAWLLKPKA